MARLLLRDRVDQAPTARSWRPSGPQGRDRFALRPATASQDPAALVRKAEPGRGFAYAQQLARPRAARSLPLDGRVPAAARAGRAGHVLERGRALAPGPRARA